MPFGRGSSGMEENEEKVTTCQPNGPHQGKLVIKAR